MKEHKDKRSKPFTLFEHVHHPETQHYNLQAFVSSTSLGLLFFGLVYPFLKILEFCFLFQGTSRYTNSIILKNHLFKYYVILTCYIRLNYLVL